MRSLPSLTTNLRLTRKLGRKAEVTLGVFNLGDRKVNEIPYCYESHRARRVAEKGHHVHPAEPRTLRLTLRAAF